MKYDDDDYDISYPAEEFPSFDFDESEDDWYDYKQDALSEQVEKEVTLLEELIIRAALDGQPVEVVDRMEDELDLLMMCYHKKRNR